ncbi:hypothetical protein ACO2Q3_13770 [Caulobacter sp. KR2-114]|uniref:hypothetical protein n=1 Tax=Caulobacter sp. KR2-114 TaxID=3400912 RepID=UPI003C11FD6D
MGFLSDIANVFGSIAKGNAAKDAAQQQVNGYNQGIDTLNNESDRINGLLSPYITSGTNATNAEGALLGLGGNNAQTAAINNLQASPLFQSLMRNGQEAILQNGSATGGLRGGNIQSSLANFGSDTLAKVIQQQLANLGGLSGQGLSAVGSSGQFGANAAGSIAALDQAAGRARAAGILDKAQADQGLYASGGDILSQILSAIPGGNGSFGNKFGSTLSNLASSFI